MPSRPRVLVIGLDGVSPDILLRRFRDVLPRLNDRLSRGACGVLKSCDPPITVPAWAVMFTGMDAGSLGLYGFRNRRPGTYFDTVAPTPMSLPYPTVWEILSRAGRRVAIIGVPPGYPPPVVNGIAVSDLLTPPGATDFATPRAIVPELEQVADGYVFDVTFRSSERDRVAEDLLDMVRKRWKLARHLWKKEAWDFFAIHEIGTDRLHHAFWKYFDPHHPQHDPDPRFAQVADRFYALLDKEVGAFLDLVDDDVTVFVVSDHGSQAMAGCFCINEWLAREGYLTLRKGASAGTPLEEAGVDWSKTRVWGAGGYYARLNVNVQDREPQGIVAPEGVPALLEEVCERLRAVRTPDGRRLEVEFAWPREVFDEVRGLAPDLFAYFDDLRWRSAGTVGHSGLFLPENDTGPDDSVHSWDGLLAASGPGVQARGPISPNHIRDVAPTILEILRVPRPATMRGQPISGLLGRHRSG